MNESQSLQPQLQQTPTHPPQTLAVDRAPTWVKGRPWLRWLLIAITGVNINTKIMGIVLALTAVLGLAVTLQVRFIMMRTLQTELHNQGVALAKDLADRAAPLILANQSDELDTLLRDTLANHPDSRYAFVLDNERRMLAKTTRDSEGVVTSGGEIPAETLSADLNSPNVTRDHLHFDSVEGRIHDFVIPIEGMGVVRFALIETRINELINDVTDQMFFTTLLVAGLAILAAMLLTWLITRPILDLVTTTEEIRRGNLSVRAPHWTDDEIGALSDGFNQMVSELEVSQQMVIEKEKARTLLLSQLISAQEEERKRIARELHDGVGQALTSILVHIKVLEQSADPATQTRMAELRQLVDETLADVRLLSRELRPSALDDLGLAAALERYVAEFGVRYPTLSVDLHCTLAQRLSPNIETSLYRIIQEAMTNCARHSHASTLSVVVTERAGVVHAIVEDNGMGFDAESIRRAGGSVGLHSMTERAELLNGSLETESGDEGTTIYIQIPIQQP